MLLKSDPKTASLIKQEREVHPFFPALLSFVDKNWNKELF